MSRLSIRKKITLNLAQQDDGVRWYFDLLPELLDNISSCKPALAYCFQQIEAAQRAGLYALLMREYRTDSELTWKAVDRLDITRKNLSEFFERISGKQLDARGRTIIAAAESTRDAITHGREKSDAQIMTAIESCLEYAKFLNQEFDEKVGFRPVRQLRGVTSKRGVGQLDKKISKAVLTGLHFPV